MLKEKGGPMTTHAIASPGRPRRSFADFYRSSGYSQFPQEHRTHVWSQLHGFVVSQQPHDFTDIASTDWVLGLPLKAACPTRFNYGDGWKQRPRSRGDFLLVPPGTEVRYEIAGPTRLMVLTWSGGLLTDLDDELFANEEAALRPLIGHYFKNNVLEAACRSLWIELARTDDASRLFLDSAVTHLAGSLLRCAARHRERSTYRRIEVRRVLAYIEDNLETDLSLTELSALAGLSLFHFAREFQAQVGVSPYRFIQQRRTQRCLRLMETKDLPIEEIARRSGFASIRSMRGQIRRHAGGGTMP
ncbi:hypothetical protein AXW83_04400 [Bosea sp. PAMC 26642]|nr:hypothetical protein AXW83_04400 [Bosea sp. PAMC 26642]